jgi:membrane associated rhomboid family serine protease
MRIKYNAPVVLTFTFTSVFVLILTETLFPNLTKLWFTVPGKGGFSTGNFRNWINLLTHAIGHANWEHLISNFSIMLLIGPILEDHYGSLSMLIMIVITAVITGLLNIFLFPTGLVGASGVVFMMILLSSFSNYQTGEIPLTFIMIVALYLGVEVLRSFQEDSVSQFAHIVGGLCGSLFGFTSDGTQNNNRNMWR